MTLKNRLIHSLVSYVQKWIPKQEQKEPQRILAVATTALGDTLWATPALESLRLSFPNAFLAALTSPIGAQILEHHPCVDRLFLLQEPLLPRFFSLWKRLYREHFDTVLLFHASQRLTLPLVALLGAKRIAGTLGINKGLDLLLTHPLPHLREHEIERRLQIIKAVGGTPLCSEISLFLKEEERAQVSLPTGRWIALHPGSKDPFKRWPSSHFIEVGRALQKKLGVHILITGSQEERALMQEVAKGIEGAVLCPPHFPLRSFAALLEKVDLLISNDTGPYHLALSLKRPTIVLFGPTDPTFYGPHRAKGATVLAKKATCTPCLKRHCQRPFCLLQISPCEVIESALQVWKGLFQDA